MVYYIDEIRSFLKELKIDFEEDYDQKDCLTIKTNTSIIKWYYRCLFNIICVYNPKYTYIYQNINNIYCFKFYIIICELYMNNHNINYIDNLYSDVSILVYIYNQHFTKRWEYNHYSEIDLSDINSCILYDTITHNPFRMIPYLIRIINEKTDFFSFVPEKGCVYLEYKQCFESIVSNE